MHNRTEPAATIATIFVGDFYLHQRWFHYDEDTYEETDEIANICKKFTSDKGYFTVAEVVDCVVEFEKEARQNQTRSSDLSNIPFQPLSRGQHPGSRKTQK
jgi:hypothetical protein